ncbi:MAG: c-type cytochrome [Mariprofundus sp.]|nr:c-type cytochrome [Mariprofundus sp.]
MRCFLYIIYIALLSPFCTAALAADAARGKVVATVRCMPCHHLDSHARSIGPGLKGVYGRAPSIDGVPFDIWDEIALQQWLANPRAVKPNTRMMIPPISVRDRTDIIAWLKLVKGEG